MKQAASIHDLKLPMLLPGITVSTNADDFAPVETDAIDEIRRHDLETVWGRDLCVGELTNSRRGLRSRRPSAHDPNSASETLVSFRSGVLKLSVNQPFPYTGASGCAGGNKVRVNYETRRLSAAEFLLRARFPDPQPVL